MTFEQASLFGAHVLPNENSQCGKILGALHAANGAWLTMPQLVLVSASFNIHSRIAELRKYGFTIENDTDRTGEHCQSRYRLMMPKTENHMETI